MFFFFNDTATTEIYTLSLHDALPICPARRSTPTARPHWIAPARRWNPRSEEHTSELQSQSNLVCRLLLEKKKKVDAHQIRFPSRHGEQRYKYGEKDTGVRLHTRQHLE